jgi:hypothetical protein
MDGRCGKTSKYFATEQKKSPSFFWMYRYLTGAGRKVLRALRQVGADIPVIISSGHAAEVERYLLTMPLPTFSQAEPAIRVGRSRG